ncbi:MAG: hypothetical protein AAF367_14355 [Pseudomonadota bacterium]
MIGLRNAARLALPARLARSLPRPARRRIIRARIGAGYYDRLDRFFGLGGDPLLGTTLWTAIDHVLERPAAGAFEALSPLAADETSFGRDVVKALCLIDRSGLEAAIDRFAALGADGRHGPFERMCARCWGMFLTLHQPGETDITDRSAAFPIIQYWNDPQAPSDVEVLMTKWQGLGTVGYHRFDDARAEQMLERAFGAGRIFRRAEHPAIRADLFRLGYLAAHDGCYIDADAVPARTARSSLARLSTGDATLGFSTAQMFLHPQNECLIAPAGHPLAIACFDEACRRIGQGGYSVQALAGGHMMADVMLDLHHRGRLGDVRVMTQRWRQDNVFTQPDLGYKSDDRNWRRWDSKRSVG